MPVHLLQLRTRLRESTAVRRRAPVEQVRPVHLPAHRDLFRAEVEPRREPAAVLAHALPIVAGEDPEVQRVVGRLADAAYPA